MDPNPHTILSRQEEFVAYVNERYANHTNLETEQSVRILSEIIFNKSYENCAPDKNLIMSDPTVSTADLFLTLLEIFLHGFDMFTQKQIFTLTDSTADVIYKIKKCLSSAYFSVKIDEVFDTDLDPHLYRDRSDYYCQIVRKPPNNLISINHQYVLDYRLIPNPKFEIDTCLSEFKAFFINDERRIFIVSFNHIK